VFNSEDDTRDSSIMQPDNPISFVDFPQINDKVKEKIKVAFETRRALSADLFAPANRQAFVA
jgi:hypothetical protein